MAAGVMATTVLWLLYVLLSEISYGNHGRARCVSAQRVQNLQPQQLKFNLSLRFQPKDLAQFTMQNPEDVTSSVTQSITHGITVIDLTANPSTSNNIQNNVGRLIYTQPLTFPFGALPSFSTSFTFLIQNAAPVNNSQSGDGIAFALTNDATPPLNSSGRFLGLTTENTNNQPDHTFFALEFDTYQNNVKTVSSFIGFDDPSNSHIGINVNSLNSVYVLDTSDHASPLYLYKNYSIKAWLEYNASQTTVRVWATNVTLNDSDNVQRPSTPILEAPNLNLSEKIHTNQLYAVITAASGFRSEGHSVFAWSFASQPPPPASKSFSILSLILGIVAALLISETTIISCILIYKYYRRYRQQRRPQLSSNPEPTTTVEATEWPAPAGHAGATKWLCRRGDVYSIQESGYDIFRVACDNFSDKNIIGEGSCGIVYWGVLSDGMEVAVKKMKEVVVRTDFYREVDILRRLDHPNLLPLLAWCSATKPKARSADGSRRYDEDRPISANTVALTPDMISSGGDGSSSSSSQAPECCEAGAGASGMLLVYPFIKNGSLDRFIGSRNMAVRKQLGRDRRLEILCQVSEALTYMHSQSCVHRDVKPSNILLTERFDAMVGDFGLARLGWPDKTKVMVTVAAAGTPGYVAPELVVDVVSWGRPATRPIDDEQFVAVSSRSLESESGTPSSAQQLVSYKTDVYSFGVLALKMASGRLYSYADIPRLGSALLRSVNLYDHEELVALLDPALLQEGELAAVELQQWRCVILLGLRCISRWPAERPDMGKVSQALRAVRLTQFPDFLDSLLLLL